MVSFSPLANSDGGDGCTAFHRSRILSKDSWDKVSRVLISVCVLVTDVMTAVGRQLISCAAKEFNTVEPPTGSSCINYMEPFINNFGGYIDNPDDFTACRYCAARTADEFLGSSFNIFYSHRWRNVGIILGISAFNVSEFASYQGNLVVNLNHIQLLMLYFFTYFFRIRKGPLLSFWRK